MNSNDLHELVKQNEENICQIAAYKGERLVYSDTWSDYKEDDCCHVMSVTKSIVSLLIATPVFAEFRYTYSLFCIFPFVMLAPFYRKKEIGSNG